MMAYPSDKMADFPSFSKWKSDASHGGFAIWPQNIWQSESQTQAMMTSDKMAIRHHVPSDFKQQLGWRLWPLAIRQGILSLKSCTSRNLTAKLSRILHSYPFARQQVWISQNGSVLKKRNFFLFLDHRLIRWPKSGREKPSRNYCVKLKCSTVSSNWQSCRGANIEAFVASLAEP